MVVAVALAWPTHAQTRRPMTLVDIAELPRVLIPQLSPDGRTLVYMQSRADWKAGRPVWHIWRQDVGGGPPTQLTFSEGGDIPAPGSMQWSPDGTTILFLRDGQIFLLAPGGGEPRALTRHATGVSAPSWTPDGSAVLFIAPDPRTSEERERDRLRGDVYALDENYKQRQIWKVAVATGAESPVTAGDSSVLDYRLSPDGTRIAMHRAPTPLPADAPRGDVWVMDASGQNARMLTRNAVEESGAALSPDNTEVLFLADANERQEPYYNTKLFLIPAAGGTPRVALPDFPYAVDRAAWAPDGRSILVVANMGVHSEVFRVEVSTGRAQQLTDGQHYITASAGGWQVVPGAGRIVVQLDEPTRFGDVWTIPLTGGPEPPTRITSAFESLERNLALPRQERVEWKGADGATVEGLLFYPIDYRPGTRYPLVVQMHGGPQESDKFGAGPGLLQNYFPVLAARGYAVLRPNYRGSAGYDDAFYRDVVGRYFRNMHLDVMAGVDALVRQGIADPDRLVLMGWSAGGHLTNKLITMTDRFKAASSGAGVAQWMSMYAQTDTRTSRTIWFGGTPWQKDAPFDAYWNNSPLKDVAAVKTPTLFFAGENDPRVPMAQSVEMYRALQSNAVPTRLLVAPREGHQWGELRHLLFKANTELEWFEKYARGRTYVWEQAP